MNLHQFSLSVALALAAAAAAAQPATSLKHDPFDWSALQNLAQERSADAPGAAQAPPRLRAVMRAPSGARADLDGAILGIGDSADGYRLLEVREHSAVFAKGGAKIELEIGENSR